MARWSVLLALMLLLLAAVALATALGPVSVPVGEAARVLARHLLFLPLTVDGTADAIVWSLRAPRVAVAALAGLALGISGAAMQGFFRNPLASPDITGVTAGGSLGAVVALFLKADVLSLWTVPVAAFLGALLSVAAVYTLATRAGRTEPTTLLLAGVGLGSLWTAIISTLFHFTEDGVLRQVVYWLMGNLSGKTWEHALIAVPFVLLSSLGLWAYSRELNIMTFGEDQARSMGVAVEKTRRTLLMLVALNTGAAVSVSGIIGFVGLIVPHIMRLLIGPDHRWLLPASGLAGASFLVLCDLLARTLAAPVELRTGIITAFFGVPFFLYLLVKRQNPAGWV